MASTIINAPITINENRITAPLKVAEKGDRGVDGIGISPDPTTLLYPINDGFRYNTNPTGTPAGVAGEVYWNPLAYTTNRVTGLGNVIQDGQELWGPGVNKTGDDLENDVAYCVYNSDMQGQQMEFDYADASDITKCGLVGVTTAAITNNAVGPVTTFGLVKDLDTVNPPSGEDWTEHDKLYISADGTGNLTNVPPDFPNHVIWIATLAYKHANNGMIFVHPVHDLHGELDRDGTIRPAVSTLATSGDITIDWDLGASVYTCAKTGPITSITLSNLPAGAWGFLIKFTDPGADHAVTYPGTWKEIEGAELSRTAGGEDWWLITGIGASDIRASQTLDWRTS